MPDPATSAPDGGPLVEEGGTGVPGWRRAAGVAAGLLTLAVVAYPAFWFAVFAHAGITGCFISCGDPEPGVAVGWSAATALLLAMPLVVGLTVGGARSRKVWLGAGALVVLAVVGWDLLALLDRPSG